MKKYPGRTLLGAVLLFVSFYGCALETQEAVYRGLAEAYRLRSQNPYVSPLGRLSEAFAAGVFDALAEQKRQERLALEIARYESERQLASQKWEGDVLKARVEIEAFLQNDKTALLDWISTLTPWVEALERYGYNRPGNALEVHYKNSKGLLEATKTFVLRINFYLANLPAYVHVNMNVERVRLEMTDYLQKRQILAENGDLVRKQIEIIVKVTKKRQQEAREIKQVF
jgi:hypothetical protein